MVELVPQIDSNITACCYIMQPIEYGLVPSMLAAGANRTITLVTIFCKIGVMQSQRFIYSTSFLYFFLYVHDHHFTRIALFN